MGFRSTKRPRWFDCAKPCGSSAKPFSDETDTGVSQNQEYLLGGPYNID